MKKILIIAALFFIYQTSHAQIMGTMTDPRDGQTYKTVSFENVLLGTSITWMAENLNYKKPDSYAYNNNEKFHNGIGLLYPWLSAIIACPPGWHLPTDSEWSILVNEFGGDAKAGKVLKGEKGWINNGNGTDSSGFNAFPAGYRITDDSFNYLGKYGYWWSSTAAGEGKAWRLLLNYYSSEVSRGVGYVDGGYSCRCVRD